MAPLITLTHARLRARQGDLRTARRILREILRESPDNVEAGALLDTLQARPTAAVSDHRRRIKRLDRWRLALLRRAGL